MFEHECCEDRSSEVVPARSYLLTPQPSKEIDELIRAILVDRPEWRQRMAVMTTSHLLRRRILEAKAPGARAAGSMVGGGQGARSQGGGEHGIRRGSCVRWSHGGCARGGRSHLGCLPH